MSAILAQFGLDAPNIPPLPSPPPIAHFLLENPIPGVALLVLIAVVLFLILNSRGKIKPAIASAALLIALAGALFAVATLIETDREIIKARTRELVAAVARVDRSGMHEVMSEDITPHVTKVRRDATRDELIARVEEYVGGVYGATGHDILDLQAAMYGPRVGRTQTRVRVSSPLGTVPSWWRIDWQLENDGVWRASRIECLWLPGIPNPGGVAGPRG